MAIVLWITVLTFRERKTRLKNKILESEAKTYIQEIEVLKLKLNPTSNDKSESETQ